MRSAHPWRGCLRQSISAFGSGSTRRVTQILEELCGLQITSTQVSRAAAELDSMLEAWRNRLIPPPCCRKSK